jgi:hypothetical protein
LARFQFYRLPRKDKPRLEQRPYNYRFPVRSLPCFRTSFFVLTVLRSVSMFRPFTRSYVNQVNFYQSNVLLTRMSFFIPVFERSPPPHVYSRNSYQVANLARSCGNGPRFADLYRDANTASGCAVTRFLHRVYYSTLPGPTYTRHGSPTRACVHLSRRSIGVVPRYRLQLPCLVRH